MADVCDDSDVKQQLLLDAAIARAGVLAAHVGHRWFDACQFCEAPTVDGLPYCDDDCRDGHRRELAIRGKQFR